MTRSSRRRFAAVAVALAALAMCPVVHAAPPSPADVESARALYVRGRELREAGDLDASLEKLKAAHALLPTPITALELARAYELVGKPLEARHVALSVERLPLAPDESKKAGASRVEAQELALRLAPVVPSITIRLLGGSGRSDVEVLVDGERVLPEALAVPRKLNPGKHVVVARAGRAETSQAVEVAAGETRLVALDVPALAHAEAPRPPRETGRPADARSWSPWTTASLAVAGAGVVVGTVTGVIAWSSASSLDSSCPSGRCPPPAHDDLSLAQTTSTVATVSFAVAGVAAFAALTFWLLSPSRTAAPPSAQSTASVRITAEGPGGSFR